MIARKEMWVAICVLFACSRSPRAQLSRFPQCEGTSRSGPGFVISLNDRAASPLQHAPLALPC